MEPKTWGPLEESLAYEFKSHELIIEALTHRSHHHENRDSKHNERLEFLGDAVLDLCVTELVMALSPHKDEGTLSKIRSQLVSQTGLVEVASGLNLGNFVRLGKGEELSGGRLRPSLLADTLEAVIAAIYLDSGLAAARGVIERLWSSHLQAPQGWGKSSRSLLEQDYKSRFQEFCQSYNMGTPQYICRSAVGPDHQRRFSMALVLQGKDVSIAEGATKKEASLRAAKLVWEKASGDKAQLLRHLESCGVNVRLSKTKEKLKRKSNVEILHSDDALNETEAIKETQA